MTTQSTVSFDREDVSIDSEDFSMDLLPGWERSFAIKFGDNDFAQAATVGDVLGVVERRLSACQVPDENLACSSQRVFYRLRRALVGAGLSPLKLTPQTQLHEVLPLKDRRKQWAYVREHSGLPLPELSAPIRLFFGLWVVATLGIWTTAPTGWMAGLAGLCLAIVVCHWSFVQVSLPATTLGVLATKIGAEHYYTLNLGRVNMREVRRILLADLALYGGVEPQTLGAATKLVW